MLSSSTQNTGSSTTQNVVEAGNFLKDLGDFFSNAFGAKPLAYGLQPEEVKRWKTHSFVFKKIFHAGAFSGIKSDYPDFAPSVPFKVLRYGVNEKFVGDSPTAGDWFYANFGYRWTRLEPGLESLFTQNNGGLAKDKEFWFDPIDFWPINRGDLTRKGFREPNPSAEHLKHVFDTVKSRWRHRENNNSQLFLENATTDTSVPVQPGMPSRDSIERKTNLAGIGIVGVLALGGFLLTRGER